MMSSDSDHSDVDAELAFAITLRNYPIVHCKSTLPKDLEKKRLAWALIGQACSLPAEKVKKKIQNMTTTTRKVFSKYATGNKPMKAKRWQKEIKRQIDNIETNSVSHGVPRGVSRTDSPISIEGTSNGTIDHGSSTQTSKRKYVYVTDEEEKMTIPQLQKVYLLECIEESRLRQETYRNGNNKSKPIVPATNVKINTVTSEDLCLPKIPPEPWSI